MDWKTLRPWLIPTDNLHVEQPALQLDPGLYHYSRQRDGQYVRYHLRIENSGQALLIAAAVEAVRLTRSGAIAAWGILEGKSDAEITKDLAHIPTAQTITDQVRDLINQLGLPNKRYPVFNQADPLAHESPVGLIAPFQADLALGQPEFTRRYIDALWRSGIPHVRFVDIELNEPLTNQRMEQLCTAVEYAEDIGMIAGARLRASQLMLDLDGSGRPVIDRLATLGIDYVVVPWGISQWSHDLLFDKCDLDRLPEAIERSNFWEFPIVLEAGLTQELVNDFESELDNAISLDISHVEVYALVRRECHAAEQFVDSNFAEQHWTPFEPRQMRQIASWIEDLADARRARLMWLPPHTAQSTFTQPRIISMLRSGPRAGADISIRVDPGGQVLPPRGPRISVGAIDQFPWTQIWNHPSFLQFRDLVSRNEHCNQCPLLTMCAAHCPADEAGWTIEES